MGGWEGTLAMTVVFDKSQVTRHSFKGKRVNAVGVQRKESKKTEERLIFLTFPNFYFIPKQGDGKSVRRMWVVPKLWFRTRVCCSILVGYSIIRWPITKTNISRHKPNIAVTTECRQRALQHYCVSLGVCVCSRMYLWGQKGKRCAANVFISNSKSHTSWTDSYESHRSHSVVPVCFDRAVCNDEIRWLIMNPRGLAWE